MRLRFTYKNYPLSKELTRKSERVGTLTHPLYGFILGAVPGVLVAMIFPNSLTLPMILLFAGIIAGPILLSMYRKKKFAQFDAEYAQILKSMQK